MESWLIGFRFGCPASLTKRKGESVIIGEQLRGLTLGRLSFHSFDRVILAVEPSTLDVNILLRVTKVACLAIKVLSCKARDSAHLLCIEWSNITSSLLIVFSLELLNGFSNIGPGWSTMEILEGCIEVALVMALLETSNN